MRCWLKLGDAQNLKHQVRVIGESATKLLWRITPSVKHALSPKVWRRFCGPNFQVSKFALSVKVRRTVMWPVIPSSKHALSAEVRRRFCGPKFQVPNI